jgi:deazaflavin-dependent oxidoreductase (nitroreductase family)
MTKPENFQPGDFHGFNQQLVEQFRTSGGVGKIGPVDFAHLVVLTTTGRRSKQRHTVPIGYATDDDGNLLLFASANAAPRDPDWYLNLEADPHVHVEITGDEWDATAEILHGAARDDAYHRWVTMAPNVSDHEEKSGRAIPMVRVPRHDRVF